MMELLKSQPIKILPTLRFAKNESVGATREADPDGESDFHPTYRKLWRIPKDFLKVYIPNMHSSLVGLTAEKLSRCERSADGTIRSLFFMGTHTMGDTTWPQFCHKKQVFREVFKTVDEKRGLRLSNLAFIEKGDKLSVDWKKSGVFVFSSGDGKTIPKVTHINGTAVELAAEDRFDCDKSWEVNDNWCELKAHLRVGKAVTKVLDLFGDEFKDAMLKTWADNKTFLQDIANENRQLASEPDAASSLPSSPRRPSRRPPLRRHR